MTHRNTTSMKDLVQAYGITQTLSNGRSLAFLFKKLTLASLKGIEALDGIEGKIIVHAMSIFVTIGIAMSR